MTPSEKGDGTATPSSTTTGTHHSIDGMLSVLTSVEADLKIRQENLKKEYKRLLGFRSRWLTAVEQSTNASEKAANDETKLQILHWTEEAVSFAEVYDAACTELAPKLEKVDTALVTVVDAKSRLIILDEARRVHDDIGSSVAAAQGAGFDPEYIQRIIKEATVIIEITKESKEYV